MQLQKKIFFLSGSLFPLAQANLNIHIIENHKDQNVLRKLKPHDMGNLHNTVMSRVHDRILNKLPDNRYDYSAIMMEEMAALCDQGDNDCISSVHDVTLQSHKDVEELFANGKSFDVRSIIPDGFDEDLANNFESIYKSILTLESDGLEAYHEELDEISNIVEESDLLDIHQELLQQLVSIGKGSGEFWTEFINNSESVLRASQNERGLQETITVTINIFDVTSADIIGGMKAAIRGFLENPLTLLNPASWITELGPVVLRGALSGSLTAMGIIIKIPSTADIITCAAATALEEANIELEDNVLVGDLVGDFLIPCNSTTLFGPMLGPIVANALPNIFEILDEESEDESD